MVYIKYGKKEDPFKVWRGKPSKKMLKLNYRGWGIKEAYLKGKKSHFETQGSHLFFCTLKVML